MQKDKIILQGHEARLRIKAGIDKAADAVKPTLGAVGMTAMIEVPGLEPIECDDGVTILKNLEFKDHYEQLGLQKLRKAAIRTSTEGGDGTATTTVLTQALVEAVFKEISQDSSKIREVRERLERGLAETLSSLEKIKRDVKEEDIEKIAAISSLDPEVSKLIAEVIKEVGINGVVTVERGPKLGYSKEVVKGVRFDRGLISPYFITDRATESTVLEDVYIVLADRKISTNEQIIPLLNSIGTGKNILFIADDVDSVALGTLAFNAQKGLAKIACVRNPFTASPARDFLFDVAALTGATVISEEMGMRLDTSDVKMCGRAEKVIVTKDSTTIIGGESSPEVIESRVKSIQDQIDGTTSEYSKKMLQDRLAQLTGGIGVIRVGTYTDNDFNAKRYKFQNAINAAQAALQEGILPGGGSALLKIRSSINEPMFKKSLATSFDQQWDNAGMGGWFSKWRKKGFLMKYDRDACIDFREKIFVDPYHSGIIDPFKVTRLALESATAIAKDLISVETVIITEDEESNAKRE